MDKVNRYMNVLEIIQYLNKKNQQGKNGYYDCGEMGIIHIWWSRNRWEWEEITLEADPTSLVKKSTLSGTH